MTQDLIFVSGEASGDELAAEVIRDLKIRSPDLKIGAIGGEGLERVGITSPFDVSALSIVGYVEALKVWRTVERLVKQIVAHIIDQRPKAVVLVDSWGFTIRIAKALKAQAPFIKRIKLIGPQVWATRAGRAKKLADCIDHLFCMHDFEVPYYEPHGLACTVIGIPAISRLKPGNGDDFKARNAIPEGKKVVLILPGSRASEIYRVAPTFIDAANILSKNYENQIQFVLIKSGSVKKELKGIENLWPENTLMVSSDGREDVMAASDFALACSGTVTTELATQGCPMVVGYRLGTITWAVAINLMFKAPYISLVNVAAGREIVPEYVQNDFTSDAVVKAAKRVLDEPGFASEVSEDLQATVKKMGWGSKPAYQVTSEKLLELI